MVMFFRLCNSSAMFQNVMNDIFSDLVAEGKVTVYMNNILIFSKDLDEYCQMVHKVLKWLEENDIYLKLLKCSFKQSEVEYLGVIVAHDTVKMNPVKVKALAEWPTPENPSDVRWFCGFANFYWKFMPHYSDKARLLIDLTKKDTKFKWGAMLNFVVSGKQSLKD